MTLYFIFVARVGMDGVPGMFIFLLCIVRRRGMFTNHSISSHSSLLARPLDANPMEDEKVESPKPEVGETQYETNRNGERNYHEGHVSGLFRGRPCDLVAEFIVRLHEEAHNAVATQAGQRLGRRFAAR